MNVYYKGKFLYSEYAPEQGAQKSAKALLSTINQTDQVLFIIPSPLLWYGCAFIQSSLQKAAIIAIEDDPALLALAQSSKTGIPLYHTRELTAGLIGSLPGWPFRRVQMLPLNRGYAIQQDAFTRIEEMLVGAIREYWANRMTLFHMLPLWIRNIYQNISSLNSFYSPHELKTSKPLIIAGAGESLESLPFIAGFNRNSFFIMAIDTALPFFYKHRIRPDAILAIDAQYYNCLDIIGLDGFRDIPLIMDISLAPGFARFFTGPKYVFMTDFWTSMFTSRLKKLFSVSYAAYGSVGIAAVIIARQITDSDIYISGLDFCYAPGKSHCRGSSFHDLLLQRTNRLKPSALIDHEFSRHPQRIRAVNGEQKYTDKSLLGYLSVLKNMSLSTSRIFSLSHCGLDTGLCVTGLKEYPTSKVTRDSFQPVIDDHHRTASVADKKTRDRFLYSEKKHLEALYQVTYQLLSGGLCGGDFQQALQYCDYCALHIPDMNPGKPHPTQLKRLLLGIARYIKTIETLID